MPQPNLEPHKVTGPFGLLATWFATLVLIVGAFLTAATKITNPCWLAPTLAISAIVFVPLFLLAAYCLLVHYRPHLQDDEHYSTWLATQTSDVGELDAGVPELPETPSSSQSAETPPRRSPLEYKILNTLWTKNVNRHPQHLSWWFKIASNAPSYPHYVEAKATLLAEGLIRQGKNGMIGLTEDGWNYCKQHYKEFPPGQWWDQHPINEEKLPQVLDQA
jgi:hypothetical protein